jgi:uncharacterized protein (DUF362 family)
MNLEIHSQVADFTEASMPRQPRIALCHGTERASNLCCALELVMDDIHWSSRRAVVVKPNLVIPHRPHAITHQDALAVVLEAVRMRYAGPLTIAEGCALHSTTEAFKPLGYETLAAFYDAHLLDLNADETVPVTVYDRSAGPLHLRLARRIVESDCRISLSLPKTHDVVLVTLSIKNMVMGSLVNRRVAGSHGRAAWRDRVGQIVRGHGEGWGSDKTAMHQGYPMINLNLALLAPLVRPHLSVLDGFVAMEGAGPIGGTPAPWGVAVAGTDPLAVDVFTAQLMGLGLDEVGYLKYCAQLGLGCADPERMEVLGNVDPHTVARPFVPHPRHHEQRRWHHPDAARLLQHDPRSETVQGTSLPR